MSRPRIVLAGNPNCGKTALFNALTGEHQRVGNWPGVTVECKSGTLVHNNVSMEVVDLPGVYSLFSYGDQCALDAKIALTALQSQPAPDLIVNVVDAANLERHLFLTTQLLDLGLPVVVAVNMLDVLQRRGGRIDLEALSKALGCPVVGIVANANRHIDQLIQTVYRQYICPHVAASVLDFPATLGACRARIAEQIATEHSNMNAYFSALAWLEGDACVLSRLGASITAFAQQALSELESSLPDPVDLMIADRRYRFCAQLRERVVVLHSQQRQRLTDRIDRIVLHRVFGFPIFLLVMYAMFFFAINIGGAFQDFFDITSDALFVSGTAQLLATWHAPAWLTAILAYGVGKGINTAVTFLPLIAGLFLFLSFLEDCGYMARATFLMDRIMRALGLPGEAFVPMIVGFGCNVPAVMGARTLANPRERVLTVMMMPFMTCGARFAIFTVFAAAFFPHHGAAIIFLLYLVGMTAAVVTGVVFRKTCLPGKGAPLVMELPAYHCPQWQSLWRITRRRTRAFLLRAGKVIVLVCAVLGALNALTVTGHLHAQQADSHSLLSVIGQLLTPVFAPIGVHAANWPATVGLLTGVLAKEVVVGTLNSLYAVQVSGGGASHSAFHLGASLLAALATIPANLSHLWEALANPVVASAADVSMSDRAFGQMVRQFGSPLAAFCYLLFVSLYFPCVSTLAAMRREVGWRWAWVSMLWSCGLAYALSVVCYQVLTYRAHWQTSLPWLLLSAAWLLAMIWGLKRSAGRVS